MPKVKISEFSSTPANNTDIDSINIAEGCAPSGINDAIRELMAQLKDFQTGAVGDSFNGPVGATTAGTGAFTTLSASSTLAVTGVATLTAQPILSSLTASRAVFTDASKGLVSNAITGTGNVVMSTSPTLVTPTLGVATATSLQGIIGNVTPAAGAFTTVDASGAVTLSGGTANGVTYLNGSKVLTSGSALVFDGANLGLGVTPSAWNSSYKAIQVASHISLWGNSAGGGALFLANNEEFVGAGTRKYLVTDFATEYVQVSGQHQWKTAPSGTAGNTISFTQAMTLDASGNLGVGTTSPSYSLSVAKAGNSSMVLAQLRNSDAGSSAATSFAFGNDTTAEAARIVYGSSTNSNIPNTLFITNDLAGPIILRTDGTERGRIAATGGIQSVTTISVGNATPSASGAGITFPATQSASSNANTLDDYEEGDVTLGATTTLTAGSGTITIDTSTSFVKYTKTGRQVTVTGSLTVSSVSSPTANLSIDGMPFSSASNCYSGVSVYSYGYAATMTTNVVGSISPNSSGISLQKTNALGGVAVLAPDVQAGTNIVFSISYFV